MTQAIFINLVRDKMISHNLLPIPSNTSPDSKISEIATQTSKLPDIEGNILSVLISYDALTTSYEVEKNEREAIYDGVILYEPDWVFVIENKPRKQDVWVEQLSSKFKGNFYIEPTPICLSWRDIIEHLSSSLEKNVLSSTEALLVEDFLYFIDNEFSFLNPYHTFNQCKDNKHLLNKRCNSIM